MKPKGALLRTCRQGEGLWGRRQGAHRFRHVGFALYYEGVRGPTGKEVGCGVLEAGERGP